LPARRYTSLHELDEFGFIDVHDPSNRNRGKLRKGQSQGEDLRALRLIYPGAKVVDYAASAIDIVMNCLKTSPVPPRLAADATTMILSADERP
jgi:hypothetical protein